MEFTTHLELHSQTTRLIERDSHKHKTKAVNGVLTLYDTLFQGTYAKAILESSSTDYNSHASMATDFKSELLPLHSPLLGQSLLVSCPPLIDMLKFSGYPYLI